jgi:TatD DNase family protein
MLQWRRDDPMYAQLVHLSLGVHPFHASTFDREEMLHLLDGDYDVIGIGEIGLDFSPHILPTQPKEVQFHAFREQLLIAKVCGKSVNVHARQAGHYAVKELHQHGIERALLHAFDGKSKYVKQALQLGYYFSVAPCIERSQVKLAQLVPLDRLVIESDTPALARVQGGTSEPADIVHVVHVIARIKGVQVEEVKEQLEANTRRLFSLYQSRSNLLFNSIHVLQSIVHFLGDGLVFSERALHQVSQTLFGCLDGRRGQPCGQQQRQSNGEAHVFYQKEE